jgi:hypothetical protein
LTPNGVRLPNSRRKKLHEVITAFENETDHHQKIKLGQQMPGRATEAAQIEKRFEALVPLAAEKLNNAKKFRKA